jgi:hypothetical protein
MKNRIPECVDFTFDGMLYWFAELSKRGLLFHPDDDPAEIASLVGGGKTFSSTEAKKLRRLLGKMFAISGDVVYEAAYPAFMSHMKIQTEV